MVDFEKAFDLWVDEVILPLLIFCIEFVSNHEGDKYSEKPCIEVISESHGSACHVSILGLLFRQDETNLLLILFNNDFLRRQSQYTLLLAVFDLSIPIELPSSHDNPPLVHISSKITPHLLHIPIKYSSAKLIKIILFSTYLPVLQPHNLLKDFSLETIALFKFFFLPNNWLKVLQIQILLYFLLFRILMLFILFTFLRFRVIVQFGNVMFLILKLQV